MNNVDDIHKVHAYQITKTNIFVKCDKCFNKYKKDGTPHKNAKNIYHIYGSNNEFHNREEIRITHCQKEQAGKYICIIVDDNTIRYTTPLNT